VHGDSPAAVRLAERIVRELASASVELSPFV
jgi:lactam utilization protein B